MKKLLILMVFVKILWSQAALQGINSYYSALSVASSGAIGLVPNTDNDQINPAGLAGLETQIQLSVIKYPADIYVQSINYIKGIERAVYGVSLRRINYGTFDAVDESGMNTGSYSASGTWLSGSFAINRGELQLGISGGLIISNIEDYSALAFSLAAGFSYFIPKVDFRVGFGLSQFGFYFSHYTDHKEKLPQRITLSFNKGLKYLPLEINTDIGYSFTDNETVTRIGGIFELPYNFNLIFGINSDNLDQATEYKNARSLLGGSGLGLSYKYRQYEIAIGGYSYGSGGWIYGTSFNYKIDTNIN